jgi:hypothetical protein
MEFINLLLIIRSRGSRQLDYNSLSAMIKNKFLYIIGVLLPILLILSITSQSVWHSQSVSDQVRVYTRSIEFDYFFWTLQSLWEKGGQAALGINNDFKSYQARLIVNDFLVTLQKIHSLENQILQIYSNPDIENPGLEVLPLLSQKSEYEKTFNQQRLLTESILQSQISSILSWKGLNFFYAPFPPVLFKITSLPDQLILSPRSVIREEASISLTPGLSDSQKDEVEKKVSVDLNVSALVVPLGGVGVYPTMVFRETSLEYLIKVVAHEWIHNFLTLRPLGWHYEDSPQLRAMNETTADIGGTEISQAVLRSFYLDRSTSSIDKNIFAIKNTQNQKFNFNMEMHTTRITVDDLLTQGKIDEAEKLMEEKRRLFWENGFQIRKLNQAYFAFYGAYAEQPIGAAGNDPVGPAVRTLRVKSSSLLDFLNRISTMTSFEALQRSISP